MGTRGAPYSSRFMADSRCVVVFSHVLGGSKLHKVVDTSLLPVSILERFWVCQNRRDFITSGFLRYIEVHLVSDGAFPAANFSTGGAWMLPRYAMRPERWTSWTSACTRRASRQRDGADWKLLLLGLFQQGTVVSWQL